jgi:hypothetical protein
MYEKSHTVYRMQIHLPDRQTIMFEEGHEAAALERARNRPTMLTEYFELNKRDADARGMLYCEVGKHYVWRNNQWYKRKVNIYFYFL